MERHIEDFGFSKNDGENIGNSRFVIHSGDEAYFVNAEEAHPLHKPR